MSYDVTVEFTYDQAVNINFPSEHRALAFIESTTPIQVRPRMWYPRHRVIAYEIKERSE